MKSSELEITQLELKYCERCGGLWLRLRGADEIYCASCAVAMPEVRKSRRARGNPQVVNRELFGCGELVMVRGEGGMA